MRNVDNRLSNSRRRKRRKAFLILFCTSLFFGVLLLRVWFSSKAVEVAFEVDHLAAKVRTLEEENKKLLLEMARLRSPERISIIATADLGMIRASDAEVITLER